MTSRTSFVILSLDFLKSEHLASMSDLIFISSIFFFSILRYHREDKNWAMFQTIGNFICSGRSKFIVRTDVGVMFGIK